MDLYKIHSVNIEAFIVQSVDQRSYLIKFGVPDDKIFIIPSNNFIANPVNKFCHFVIPKLKELDERNNE